MKRGKVTAVSERIVGKYAKTDTRGLPPMDRRGKGKQASSKV